MPYVATIYFVIAGKKLMITGAFGFVGQSFIDWLIKQPPELHPSKLILVTNSQKNLNNVIREINSEILLSDLGQPWNFDFDCDYLINLAADGSANAYSSEASELFLRISNHMISWLQKKESVRFFHASSGACEGIKFNNSQIIPEDLKKLFESKKQSLIDSRLNAEDAILQKLSTSSINGSIGRLFSFIGPRIISKHQYAASSFLAQAQHSKKIRVSGNPNTVRSYLSSDDLSSWIYKAIQLDSKPVIMNFGSKIPVTIGDLASYIAIKTNAELELLHPELPSDIYVADNQKTLDLLKVSEGMGWREQIDGVIRSGKDMIL